jgi:ABC-2 type transport system permease protein
MSGSVFLETLRRGWRSAFYWAAGIAAMGIYTTLALTKMEILSQYGDIMKSMPAFILNMVGGGDAAFLTTPEGFLSMAFFSWTLLVFATFAVLVGLNVTANEEDRGTLDVLLSMPIPRWRIIVEKVLADIVILLVILVITVLVLWLSIQGSPTFNISFARLAEATLNFLPSTLVVLTFTVFVGTVVRRRNVAATIAAVFVAASYFVDVIGRTVRETDTLRRFSFYSYYDSASVMQYGLQWGSVIGLLAVAALLFAGSIYFFQRRDLSV